jgi:hypothetical protein
MIEASTLDAAIADVPAKPRIMPSGVRRWIPAAVEMNADGFTISDAFIADAAATLNGEAVSIPIDGGTDDSEAHETASKRAVGWAHRAAVVDGQLFLEAEVLPDVAKAIDAGTLAYSSIDVDFMTDDAGEYVAGTAHLITHALTNTPRNRGIAPMQAVQHGLRRTVHSYTRARLASEESMGSKTTKKAEATAEPVEPVKVETVQAAEPPPAEDKPEMQAADEAPAMTLEDAMAKIAELEAKLAAMEAASEASAIEAATETAEQKRESAAVAAVERAIGEGRITAHARDKWLASARSDLATFTATVAKRPAMTRPITARAESSGGIVKSTVQTYSEDEIHLAAMLRSGGVPEDKIKMTIARKRGEVV